MTEENNNPAESEKIVLGGRADEIVKCSGCEKDLKVEERHAFEGEDGNDIYFCEECLTQINAELDAETKNPNIPMALVLGSAAGILGAIIWYWITALTNYQIGYAAIGLGWLIAMAVSVGAGHKKGGKLQFISVLITLAALLCAEFMIGLHYIAIAPEYNTTALVLFNQVLSNGIASLIGTFIGVIIGMVSPIGLVIWGFALYAAFVVPKARKLV